MLRRAVYSILNLQSLDGSDKIVVSGTMAGVQFSIFPLAAGVVGIWMRFIGALLCYIMVLYFSMNKSCSSLKIVCIWNFLFNRYLQITKSKLEMDFFNFDWYVRIFNEFKPEREFYRIQDISYGKENFAVSCVNSLDKNYPEYVEYSKVRLPKLDVEINTGNLIALLYISISIVIIR